MPRLPVPDRVAAPLMAVLAALVLSAPLAAQSLEDRLRTLGAENARRYSHPVSSGLAAGMGSGWHHSARPLDVLGVELSLQAVGAIVPEEDDTFRPALPGSITVPELGGRTFSNPYGTSTMITTPTAAGTTNCRFRLAQLARRQAISGPMPVSTISISASSPAKVLK